MNLYLMVLNHWKEASLSGLLLAVLVSGYCRVWIWGSQYQEVVAQRDEWKGMALRALHVAEQGALPPGVKGEALPPSPATVSLREARERVARLEGLRP